MESGVVVEYENTVFTAVNIFPRIIVIFLKTCALA